MVESMDDHCSIKRKVGIHSIVDSLPRLRAHDYYIFPSEPDLAALELANPGYLTQVTDFVVGRIGYGCVKFLGETDVRNLEVDRVVRFLRNEIVVYGEGDFVKEPPVGEGLNKPAEVTLKLKLKCGSRCYEKLKLLAERQGAQFISFDLLHTEWKFLVPHFSRFGLSQEEEEDISMDDAVDYSERTMEKDKSCDLDNNMEADPGVLGEEPLLYHSLPAHLRLDPVKMKEMRMMMFPSEAELEMLDGSNGVLSQHVAGDSRENPRNHVKNASFFKVARECSPTVSRKKPVALLEYNTTGSDPGCHGGILMCHENKDLMLKTAKSEGFQLDLRNDTPVSGSHSRNIVDAGLFMGRSFRVGWGPNGLLVHSGAPVGSNSLHHTMSSIIRIEKVAFDTILRDKNNKLNEELVDLAFESPLNLHKKLHHETNEIKFGTCRLKLQKSVSTRLNLSETCRSYISIIEKHLEASVSNSRRLVLMHQVMIWELIKVLFSERESYSQSRSISPDNEDNMMQEVKENSLDVDEEALPLIRRAEFSRWLQESVYHRVQEDVSSLDESSYLDHIFLMLTGRQLDGAVELAASKGDVRLSCLLSQAGCSTVNRADIGRQLNVWRMNGLDFNFVEKERIRIYKLLSGNIVDALLEYKIDWKRVLGLLMWFGLSPDMPLSKIFNTYHNLLEQGQAPFPLPVYIDEGPIEETVKFGKRHFDLSYYLMLLHSSTDCDLSFLRSMFSALSSTPDPLDFHMIWHHRDILEAAGIFAANNLQVLDMGLVSQLLCVGKCHWAIYVVLHMRCCEGYPHLHDTVIREILFQYCETWNSNELQRQFIEDLDIPQEWLHEALAVYFSYYGDHVKALEHCIQCRKWQKAHLIFVTSVAHSLFLSGNHDEVWSLATSMEDKKDEIENWDLGAGLYITFYLLASSSKEDPDNMTELDSLESRKSACGEFLLQLNDSLKTLERRLPTAARVAYAQMGKAISDIMLSDASEATTRDLQLNCFRTVLAAPLPEDVRLSHFQDAVALFTCYLSEMAS